MSCRALTAGGAAFLTLVLSACVSTDTFQKDRTEMNERMTALQAEVVRNATLLEETRKEFRAFQAEAEAEKRKRDLEFISLHELFDLQEYGNIPAPVIGRYLDLITPPPNATAEQKRKFINEISSLRINGNSEKLRIRLINSLVNLGHEYFEDILAHAGNSQYFQEAAARLVRPSDKALLKKMLETNPARRYTVLNLYMNMADASDRADVLRLLPGIPGLASCVKRLGIEKEALPVIKKQLLENRNVTNESLNLVLDGLAPAERQAFMEKYWRFTSAGAGNHFDLWRNADTAFTLARKGFLPAFAFLVENRRIFANDTARMNALLLLTPLSDSAMLGKWYEENRGKLVFNSEKGYFEAGK